jgi:quinoprotein glucose dehydrogenase
MTLSTSAKRFLPVLLLASSVTRADAPPSDWRNYLKDPGGTRFTTLDQINRANVRDLRVAWVYHTGQNSDVSKTTIECNPLVIDGVMYLTSPLLDVISLDAGTGKEIWRYNPFPGEHRSSGRFVSALILALSLLLAIAAVRWFLRRTRLRRMEFQFPIVLLLVGGAWFSRMSFHVFPNPLEEERRLGPNRGLTYWESGADKRILFAGGHKLVALNANTGKPIATFGEGGAVDLTRGLGRDVEGMMYTVTSPGAIYRDLIILGSKVGEGPTPAAPGHLRAFDVRTGKQRWIFHTIPQPGESGYETWPLDAWKRVGGANTWGGLTVDEPRGLVFAATGSPTFDFYGGDRPGTNLFGNSLLALNAETGKLVWYFQAVHHDIWDYDLPTPPNLVTLHRDGRDIDVAVQLGKNAMIYVLDRDTGKPVFPVEERAAGPSDMPGEQPWPTQPFPSWPPPLARQQITEADLTDLSPEAHAYALENFRRMKSASIYMPPSKQGTIVSPGFHGGSNWSGASFDPVRGRLVANTNDVPYVLTMHDAKPWARYRFSWSGFPRFVDREGYPAIRPPWGKLTAIDLNTHKVAWQIPFGEYKELTARGIPPTGTENAGGSVITSGGLIFIGATKDEKFRAFDIDSGRVLWEAQLNAGAYATPSVYSVKGKQFVVVAAGGGGMVETRSGDEYVAFALPARR